MTVTLRRYRGRHLKPRPRARGPAAVGTAAALWMAAPARADAGTHVVRRGETLSGIAARYGTSVTRLVRANHVADPNFILAGARLKVPGAGGTARRMHRVGPGDTLSGIAARYGTSVAALARANRIADPNLIVIGSRLRVPAGRAASSGGSVEAVLEQVASRHGVDPALVKAIAWQESGWNQKAVSSAGAIGVMQVMPGTADQVNGWGGTRLNVRKTAGNVELGVRYLRYLLDIMPDEKRALAGYYTGPGAVGKRLSKVQRPYVRSVQALKRRY